MPTKNMCLNRLEVKLLSGFEVRKTVDVETLVHRGCAPVVVCCI